MKFWPGGLGWLLVGGTIVYSMASAFACRTTPEPLPAGPEPEPQMCPEPAPCPPCAPGTPAPPRIIRLPPCKLAPPPEAPHVAWAPPDCPVRKFGACLSTEDAALVLKYLQAMQVWKADAYKRCSDGK
jgi:hypothetical protein